METQDCLWRRKPLVANVKTLTFLSLTLFLEMRSRFTCLRVKLSPSTVSIFAQRILSLPYTFQTAPLISAQFSPGSQKNFISLLFALLAPGRAPWRQSLIGSFCPRTPPLCVIPKSTPREEVSPHRQTVPCGQMITATFSKP